MDVVGAKVVVGSIDGDNVGAIVGEELMDGCNDEICDGKTVGAGVGVLVVL
jgi:hypothetical protein